MPELVVDAVANTAPGAVACLLGVSPRGRTLSLDVGALNNELVLENDVVFGSVNANHRHFQAGRRSARRGRPRLAQRLITRRVRLERWSDALDKGPEDIKTIIEFNEPREVV